MSNYNEFAHPVDNRTQTNEVVSAQKGMTKLEYFTALSMQGIQANYGETALSPSVVAAAALATAKATLDALSLEDL